MYQVRDGDTLAGIAASLWGDSSLWYKIAELNGLTADSALIEGTPLLIPVGVERSTKLVTHTNGGLSASDCEARWIGVCHQFG